MFGILYTLFAAGGIAHSNNKYSYHTQQQLEYYRSIGAHSFVDDRGICRSTKTGNMAYHKGGCLYDSKTDMLLYDPNAEKRKREADTRHAFYEASDFIPMEILGHYKYYRKDNSESSYYLYLVETPIGERYYYMKYFDKYTDFKKGQLVATANIQMIDDMKSGRGCQKEFDNKFMEEFNNEEHIIIDDFKPRRFKVVGGFIDDYNLSDVRIPLEDIKYIKMWKGMK